MISVDPDDRGVGVDDGVPAVGDVDGVPEALQGMREEADLDFRGEAG
jgi:hypothetical protein